MNKNNWVQMTFRAARVNADLSQEYAASKLGISSVTLRKYETGECVPRADVLHAMSKLYGAPVDQLAVPRGV